MEKSDISVTQYDGTDEVEMAEETEVTPFKARQMTQEIGVLPIGAPFGGFTTEEEFNLTDVSIEELDKMCRTDGTARSLYNIITLPIRAAKWSLVPAEDGEEERNFIEAMFTEPPYRGGMSTPMDYVIAVAAKAVRQGFVAWEKVYRIGTIQYPDAEGNIIRRDNAILLRKLAPRPSHQVTFLTDDTGGFNGFRQRVNYKGRYIEATIPREKALVYTVNKHENPLYGESMFLPAYYHYDKKHKLYYVAHLAYMMNAIPARLGRYPANAKKDVQEAFKRALANLGVNSVVTVPQFSGPDVAQYEVETFESRRQLADFTPLINHHNSEMAKSVLAQFIELGQSGKGGSYALGQDQSEFFLMAIEAIMAEIAYTFNSYLIPEFIDYNFGTGRYPTFQFEPLVDSTKELLKSTFEKLVNASSKQVSDEFMLEMERRVAEEFGFDVDYEELRKRQEEDSVLDREVRRAQKEREIENAKNPPQFPPGPEGGRFGFADREVGGGLREFLTELHAELEEFESIIEARDNNPE